MARKPHLVIADDEADIRETVQEYLELQGFRVTPVDSGPALRTLLSDEAADLVLLDINMPGEDGLSLARFLRERGGIGIVMLTSASAVIDRIVGLEIGADDYITKPFDLRELRARVRAVLRRMEEGGTGPVQSAPADRVIFGRHSLDLAARKLFDPDGREVTITAMEFDLLKVFAERPNRVLNRDQLQELAHHREWDPFDRSIDIRIMRLRKKIESDPRKPTVIKTVRGVGYVYVPPGRR